METLLRKPHSAAPTSAPSQPLTAAPLAARAAQDPLPGRLRPCPLCGPYGPQGYVPGPSCGDNRRQYRHYAAPGPVPFKTSLTRASDPDLDLRISKLRHRNSSFPYRTKMFDLATRIYDSLTPFHASSFSFKRGPFNSPRQLPPTTPYSHRMFR